MVLKETTNEIRLLLSQISEDLEKSAKGNRAASQRVRTGPIKFSHLAKLFRKESVAAEKGPKKAKKSSKKTSSKKKR